MLDGKFITFEGPEGAGKTTVLAIIAKRLKEKYKTILVTREPGGITISEKIRDIILNPDHIEMNEHTEALLYAAARSQHYFEKIEPSLKEGTLVLCDRFIDSSLVYQGYARGLGIDNVRKINSFAIGDKLPDITILFDLPPEIGLSRITANRERENNRLDQEHLAFHQKVREGYLQLASKDKERIVIIDANQEITKVVEDVWQALLKKLI